MNTSNPRSGHGIARTVEGQAESPPGENGCLWGPRGGGEEEDLGRGRESVIEDTAEWLEFLQHFAKRWGDDNHIL